jgi:hypothetical protein
MSAVPYVSTSIRRDSFNTISTLVPAHEVVILQALYGEENITAGEKKGTYSFDDASEMNRLARKYGAAQLAENMGKAWPTIVKTSITSNAVKTTKTGKAA